MQKTAFSISRRAGGSGRKRNDLICTGVTGRGMMDYEGELS